MPDTFPSGIIPSTLEFGLRSNTQTFSSPLTASTQTLRLAGASWYGKASFDDLSEDNWRKLAAFLVNLEGKHGRFYFMDFGAAEPQGAMKDSSNTILVNGASQTGGTLNIDGLPANVNNAFLAGDYIAFDTSSGRELKIITANASSNGSGQASISIKPNIRVSPANNATVSYRLVASNGITNADTCCIFRLESDTNSWNIRPPTIANISINFVESFA